MGGITSILRAGKILQQTGKDIAVRALGLACGSSTKAAAFEQAGIPFLEDWESLMDRVENGSRP